MTDHYVNITLSGQIITQDVLEVPLTDLRYNNKIFFFEAQVLPWIATRSLFQVVNIAFLWFVVVIIITVIVVITAITITSFCVLVVQGIGNCLVFVDIVIIITIIVVNNAIHVIIIIILVSICGLKVTGLSRISSSMFLVFFSR